MARGSAGVGGRAAGGFKDRRKERRSRAPQALWISVPAPLHANQGMLAAGGPTSRWSRAEGRSGRCPFGARAEAGQGAAGLALVWVVFPRSLASAGTSRAPGAPGHGRSLEEGLPRARAWVSKGSPPTR